MKGKSPLRRRLMVVNAKNYKIRKSDEGKCSTCGGKMPEDDFGTECKKCRRWHSVRTIAYRHFLKDFR